MIEISEMLPPQQATTNLWSYVKQAGVTRAVGQFYARELLAHGEDPWDFLPLMRVKNQYENFGFSLEVIEDRPPLNLTKRGLPGRDEEIESVITLIRNMGKLEIPVWCYEWMADFNWARTDTSVPSRGGSFVTGFSAKDFARVPPSELGPLEEETLWDSLQYFLDAVVPIAEESGVKLAMHPDDPPTSPLRGIGRIMRNVDNFQRLVDLRPSPANGITLCQGNFRLMTDDLPAVIRKFGAQGKIFFVHMRDVRGTIDNFVETWHDDGTTDLYECFRTYREIGYEGVLRSDHVPTLSDEDVRMPGYGTLGRLFAIGYLKGLRDAAYR
jgi:mannonate dehydratase